jgi:hypothetical protein
MCASEGPEVRDVIASATHIVAYQFEIRNVGKKASGHFTDAFATNPGLTAINDDVPIRGIEGRNGFR